MDSWKAVCRGIGVVAFLTILGCDGGSGGEDSGGERDPGSEPDASVVDVADPGLPGDPGNLDHGGPGPDEGRDIAADQGVPPDTAPVCPEECNDDNPCTDDWCDLVAGCQHRDNALRCNDGNPCTFGDACLAGRCQGGQRVTCDDQNPCTEDACVDGTGCVFTPVAGPRSCDDGNPCTSEDACDQGVCTGTWADCDDGNPCTGDSCDLLRGECVHKPLANPCDDGNPCTTGDRCVGARCEGADPTPCDDGNACTADRCDQSLGGCISEDPATACDDGNPCTNDTCDPATGCRNDPNLASCDDGNPCTIGDGCSAGSCKGAAVDCNDGNPCTSDSCDRTTGECVHGKVPPGTSCTATNVCGIGSCSGTTCMADLVCDDGNPCTDDVCASLRCTFVPRSGPCEDGDFCTVGESCSAKACTGGQPRDCDDGNPCTADSCDREARACRHVPVGGPCDDGNACTTGDACSGGVCVPGTGKDCDDGNACTADWCHPKTNECWHVAIKGSCDDGNPCTQGDACQPDGTCSGTGAGCDDGNPCTRDSCDPRSGKCLHGAEDCSDGDACTLDACDPGTGQCTHQAIACPGDRCMLGRCTTGHLGTAICVQEALQCALSLEACQENVCNPETGACEPRGLTGSTCDDRNPCTSGDHCVEGACVGFPKCDDGNDCTRDTCSKDGACKNTALIDGTRCSDPPGSACWVGRCKGGRCEDVQLDPCDDGVTCTADRCMEPGGCSHEEQDPCMPCSGTMRCLDGRTCQNGLCVDWAGLDDPCETDDDCGGFLQCVMTSQGRLCRLRAGMSCLGNDNACASGFCFTETLPDQFPTQACPAFPWATCSCNGDTPCVNSPGSDEYCHPFHPVVGQPGGLCYPRRDRWVDCSGPCKNILARMPAECHSDDPDRPVRCAEVLSQTGADIWLCLAAPGGWGEDCLFPEECASGICLPGGTCGCSSDEECGPKHWCVLGICSRCCTDGGWQCNPCPIPCNCGTYWAPETCMPGCPQ